MFTYVCTIDNPRFIILYKLDIILCIDTNGDGYHDEAEVEALFQREVCYYFI